MKSRHQFACAMAVLWLGLVAGSAAAAGIVVEEVGAESALGGAGLRPGDLVIAWERSPEPPANPEGGSGEIRTVFDWLWLKTEQAPRGTVKLRGERNGTAISFEIPKGSWEARVRPQLTPDLLAMYEEGRRRLQDGDPQEGIALWEPLVQGGHGELRCWILFESGEAWAKDGQRDKARSAWQAALAEARDAQTRVALWEALGDSFQDSDEIVQAEASFRSALEAGETAWGESLRVASTISKLGNVVGQTRLEEATQLQARALEIRQRWTPDSLEVANSLNQLSILAWHRGDLEAMSGHAQRALQIQERWSPGSLPVATSLSLMAMAAMDRGFFDEAAVALQRAIEIQEKRAPDSLYLAGSLTNLGSLATQVGDTDSAIELQRRAMTIWEKLAPDGTAHAVSLTNLGLIAQRRGDLAEAEGHFKRALAIWEKVVPEGRSVAGILDLLGGTARQRGDLAEAEKLYRRAFEIVERLAPGSRDAAMGLSHLGLVALERGDLKSALDFYQRAHASLELRSPGTADEARMLQQLGRLHRRMKDPVRSAQLLNRAVEALESQVGRLGGSEGMQAEFRAKYEEIYRDAIEVELELGHAAAAFHLVERSRARSFLMLLTERDLRFSGELPAALERSLQDNAARYDRTLRELSRWTPAAGEEAREALHRELSRLRRERDGMAAEVRKASPRLAALRQPQPLDLATARNVLDPGTLALSYSVGKERTVLFAVTREGEFQAQVLPIGEEALRRDVERLLEQVRSPAAPTDLEPIARSLYRALIAPVADLVERSERVLILPDGPLHRLPFGALIRDPGRESPGRGQFLTEWKPLHIALSLTVYGTRSSGGAPSAAGPARLVAFADPQYPAGPVPSAVREPVRRALGPGLRGFNWAPLPHSRREVERIAEVFPEARLYLGAEATEERAKSVSRDVRVLHFATHGYVDDRTPLDSALVLTIPEGLPEGRDNGLLQVWEILESVRLDADLVVLSACESALGRELSGEGMIGLTRAFQYAGARSVVASLWSVADQVTAELMARFHRHRAAGLAKDEALRRAQIELIREPIRITAADGQTQEIEASSPFFWAAFQLFGDWR